ncbi:hypothetical protein DSO57_1025311 [Entomophthora muscae]|uniref:Uncharacterized protein n=1 Tax=Entomophthora muscae TaxID=34485 RepID=A0ACC2S4K5_9FUNG|nr:hypothetical protein DSO57_1025311 [Entomophthora muscae]
MNNLTNVPTVLPDCLPQALEGLVAPSYGADHSPDKDVHVVQKRSQAKAKGKAQAVVSKPYARQLLDKAPNEGPGPSTDTLHFNGLITPSYVAASSSFCSWRMILIYT